MDNLIIASENKDQMRLWLEVLAPQYKVTFTDNIDMLISTEQLHDDKFLLIIDANLINKTYQIPLLCKYANKVIVVGENLTPSQQIQFIYEGALGYSDRLIDKPLIMRTIKSVLNNEIWLKRQLVPQILKGIVAKQSFFENHEPFDNEICKTISILTQREIEIVEHVYNGEDNISIAEQLNITNRTVKAHMSSIFRKLKIEDRFKLVVFIKNLQFGQLASADNLF